MLFRYTTTYASGVIGAKLNCTNCHLGGGSIANSGPLWAAYPALSRVSGEEQEGQRLRDAPAGLLPLQ